MPWLSVIIPCLNEEQNLPQCLASLVAQDYPKDRLEVLVVDGGSDDATRSVASSFSGSLNVRLVDNADRREAEWGKGLAIRQSTADLIQCMDADMWLTDASMLRRLASPLAEDADLAGSIAPYQISPSTSIWSRYLSLDPFQRDPLCAVMTPDIDGFVVEDCKGWKRCYFNSPRIPPVGGTTMFRRAQIDLKRWGGYFLEVDHPAYLVKSGYPWFAYVNDVGWAHRHCETLTGLVQKRIRNISGLANSYLNKEVHRDYVWFDTRSLGEVTRLAWWVFTTNLVLPRLVEGAVDAMKSGRREAMLRPIVALAVCDGLLFALVKAKSVHLVLQRSHSDPC